MASDIAKAPCMACMCGRELDPDQTCCPDCPCVIRIFKEQEAELNEYRAMGTHSEIRRKLGLESHCENCWCNTCGDLEDCFRAHDPAGLFPSMCEECLKHPEKVMMEKSKPPECGRYKPKKGEVQKMEQITNRRELFETAVEIWGEDAQTDMMIEESSELIKALLKYRRLSEGGRKGPNGAARRGDILEEMADTQIMLWQMALIYGNPDAKIEEKLERLHERLDL